MGFSGLKLRLFIFLIFVFASIVANGSTLSRAKAPVKISDKQVKVRGDIKIEKSRAAHFELAIAKALEKFPQAQAAYVFVQGDEVLLCGIANADKKFSRKTKLPLGTSSRILLSLAASASGINLDVDIRDICEYIRFSKSQGSSGKSKITLNDLIACRAGIFKDADNLVRTSVVPEEVFDLLFQHSVISRPSAGIGGDSLLGVSAAGYACAIKFTAEQDDYLIAYKIFLTQTIFAPLEISEPYFVSETNFELKDFNKIFTPARGLALNIEELGKWLSCEVSYGRSPSGNQVLDADLLALRYQKIPDEFSKRSQVFSILNFGGVELYASVDTFGGLSHAVCIAPKHRAAFAIFIKGAPANVCAEIAMKFSSILNEQ